MLNTLLGSANLEHRGRYVWFYLVDFTLVKDVSYNIIFLAVTIFAPNSTSEFFHDLAVSYCINYLLTIKHESILSSILCQIVLKCVFNQTFKYFTN